MKIYITTFLYVINRCYF